MSITKFANGEMLLSKNTSSPPNGSVIGLHWLIKELGLRIPIPAVRSEIAGSRRTIAGEGILEQYPRQYAPKDLIGHIRFALRYEPVFLDVFRAAFKSLDSQTIEKWVRHEPTGIFARKAWYLYEGLTGNILSVPDLKVSTFVDLLDPRSHVVGPSTQVKRQRVNDNLLGDFRYSPIVRRTASLEQFRTLDLSGRSKELVESVDPVALARAINYLYTAETRSSYAIEGETPSPDRAERFVAALQNAGQFNSNRKQSYVELQNVIVDQRYAQSDWRSNQNYVGSLRRNFDQYVHYVSPKPADVPELMDGWMNMGSRLESMRAIDPVCAAATESFGFVYIHPFEDANGRIHRFLVHHVLAKLGFTPTGVIFPISAAMLRDPGRYVNVLDIVSKSIRPFIQFTLDDDGHMTVTNETADLYRYLDVTAHAEYLYWCIDQTIQKDLREELDFLGFFDEALKATINVVDMPDGKASLLVKLIHQNGGRLSKTKRALFSELTDAEISQIEEAIRKASARI